SAPPPPRSTPLRWSRLLSGCPSPQCAGGFTPACVSVDPHHRQKEEQVLCLTRGRSVGHPHRFGREPPLPIERQKLAIPILAVGAGVPQHFAEIDRTEMHRMAVVL